MKKIFFLLFFILLVNIALAQTTAIVRSIGQDLVLMKNTDVMQSKYDIIKDEDTKQLCIQYTPQEVDLRAQQQIIRGGTRGGQIGGIQPQPAPAIPLLDEDRFVDLNLIEDPIDVNPDKITNGCYDYSEDNIGDSLIIGDNELVTQFQDMNTVSYDDENTTMNITLYKYIDDMWQISSDVYIYPIDKRYKFGAIDSYNDDLAIYRYDILNNNTMHIENNKIFWNKNNGQADYIDFSDICNKDFADCKIEFNYTIVEKEIGKKTIINETTGEEETISNIINRNQYNFNEITVTFISDSAIDPVLYRNTSNNATNITTCQTLNTEGAYYLLKNNVNSTGDCFDVNNNNITIDCNGYNITYGLANDNSYVGIYSFDFDQIYVYNCTINGSSNYNNGGAGIYMENRNNNIINNAIMYNNGYGIQLINTNQTVISKVIISNVSIIGLYVVNSKNDTISMLNISLSENDGILLENSYNIILSNMNLSKNKYNFDMLIGNNYYNNTIDTSNIVDYSYIIYYNNSISNYEYNITSAPNAGLIVCQNCNNITIKDLNLSHYNYQGIYLINTNNSIIKNTTSGSNDIGYNLYYAQNISIYNITSSYNNDYDIILYQANNITLLNLSNLNNSYAGLHLQYTNNSNFSNINVTGSGSANSKYAIYNSYSNYNTFSNMNVSLMYYGIYMLASNYSNYSYISFINMTQGIYPDFSKASSYNIYNTINISNASQYGIYLTGIAKFINNSFININIWNIGQSGFVLVNSINNTLLNNVSIWNTKQDGLDIGTATTSSFSNLLFINLNIFNSSTGYAIKHISNGLNNSLFYYNNSYGQISWSNGSNTGFLRNITVKGNLTYPGNVMLTNDSAYINATAFAGQKINSSLNITFVGLKLFKQPLIYLDGALCANTICNNQTPISAGTVVMNTTKLGNFTIYENGDILAPSIFLYNPSIGLKISDTATNITFNWSVSDNNASTTLCNLTLDNIANLTSINTTNNTYTTRSLNVSLSSMHQWNMTCADDSGNSNSSSTSNFTITSCVYVSGNYRVQCNDMCNFTSSINLNKNNMTFNGVGTITSFQNVTNYRYGYIFGGCKLWV